MGIITYPLLPEIEIYIIDMERLIHHPKPIRLKALICIRQMETAEVPATYILLKPDIQQSQYTLEIVNTPMIIAAILFVPNLER